MKATVEISPDAVAYVFGNAFHYDWFRGVRIGKHQPEAFPACMATTIFEDKAHSQLSMLVACGGTVEVQAVDPDTDTPRWYTVTSADFERAYAEMIKRGGKYLSQLFEGGADVNDCDCWLQFAVFRKLVYG